ncbi:MAG: AraC family transcriptional regulator [Balneola sp.]|nr:AraC family transcriptional regulator [Balneola sp.]
MEFVSNKLYVKYMVSLRCKMIVKSEIEDLGLNYKITPHGALEFHEQITVEQYDLLKNKLLKSGMVLLNESESMLIDKIINTIIEVVHYSENLPKLNFTDLINKHAISGDESLLKIFSDVKGVSVLQFIINQKIERAKELLLYDEISLSEIADSLNYKNKNYLLAQFKKVTGLTPSYFKRLKKERTKNAEQLSKPHTARARE